jgi:hypothetical protein
MVPRHLQVFHRLAIISVSWGFSAEQTREFSTAWDAGDWHTLEQLQQRNRAFVVGSQREFAPEPEKSHALRNVGEARP